MIRKRPLSVSQYEIKGMSPERIPYGEVRWGDGERPEAIMEVDDNDESW